MNRQYSRQIIYLTVLFLSGWNTSTAFTTPTSTVRTWQQDIPSSPLYAATSTDEEEASAITEFMAKAHEEKIAAMGRVEAKYREQVAELQKKVVALETALASQTTTPTSGNSFAFPATNKDLTSKVKAYRAFIADYIVKAQEEKYKAVKTAEEKLKAKYEAIIADLQKSDETE
jgi:hypothetical protein